MQPNDQQGYYNSNQGQPVVSSGSPPPLPPASVKPPVLGIDPTALQAALNEPGPAPAVTPVVNGAVGQDMAKPDEEDDEESLEDPISWEAHEYIHQEKGAMWFTLFGIVVIVLGVVSIFLMKSWSFAVLLAVIAVVVIVYSRRPPRELTYTLSEDGLTIDSALNKFDTFKSFGVIRDGQEHSVMLIPTQRFQPGVSVYFPEELGEEIVDILGSQLPMKDLHLDVIDHVVRLLRL